MHHILECPACSGLEFQRTLAVEDYAVSHETFFIDQCTHCELQLTNPQPAQENIARYYQSNSYISHNKKSTSAFDRLYKLIRMFTIRWKHYILTKYFLEKRSSILDLGCGTGHFLKYLKKKGIPAEGVEPSPTARMIASENTGSVIHASLDTVTSTFDAVTAWHVLEHVPAPNETLKRLHRLLNQNGTLFIAVPNPGSYDAKKYQEYWAGYDVPRHLWHFSKQSMTILLEKNKFDLLTVIPMKLDAYYVSLLSEKYIRKKITLAGTLKSIFRGFISNLNGSITTNHSSLIYIARKNES